MSESHVISGEPRVTLERVSYSYLCYIGTGELFILVQCSAGSIAPYNIGMHLIQRVLFLIRYKIKQTNPNMCDFYLCLELPAKLTPRQKLKFQLPSTPLLDQHKTKLRKAYRTSEVMSGFRRDRYLLPTTVNYEVPTKNKVRE